jgi:glycosyltransferase involved in cell wall biosynthesis
MAAEASGPLASVIVPVRNAESSLPRLLASLAVQTLGAERFELLIVDDCSDDGTALLIDSDPDATLIRSPRRGGSYAARNLGLEAATAPVIAFTDGDCEAAPDWLERGLGDLDRLEADLLAGAITGSLSDRPSLAELIDFAQGLDQERHVEEWGFAATANLFVRRPVFDAIGPFNPLLISGGDAELSFRATEAGFRLRYSAAPVVRHDLRRRARDVAKKSFRMGFGAGQVVRHGQGPGRDRPRIWTNPRMYLPRRGLVGGERLRSELPGIPGAKLVALDIAQHLTWRLPLVAGDLAASLRRGRAF